MAIAASQTSFVINSPPVGCAVWANDQQGQSTQRQSILENPSLGQGVQQYLNPIQAIQT